MKFIERTSLNIKHLEISLCSAQRDMNAVSDVLGEEGRTVGNACVKVKIIGEPEDYARKKYTWNAAVERLQRCYAGYAGRPVNFASELLLPREYDDKGNVNREKTYNILDIHNALKKFDEKPFVEKYPRPGTGRDELEKLIDKRRADVEKEHAEATADPKSRREYSWLVAHRRVRDCFAGNFASDSSSSVFFNHKYKTNATYNIFDIFKTVLCLKESGNSHLSLENISLPSGPGSDELKMSIRKNIFDLEEEKKKAQTKIKQYSKDEAEKRVKECFPDDTYLDKNIVFFQNIGNGETYNIFHIYTEVERLSSILEGNEGMCKSVTKEYEAALKEVGRYSLDEAARRVRDCLYPGYQWSDTDVFPDKFKDERVPKTKQTYYISDIKNSIDYFDKRKFLDKCLPENNKYPEARETNEIVNKERENIREEYVKATEKGKIDHGSGFIINDHYVITDEHVIRDADGKEIVISNASISELPCKVVYTDGGKDLALLCCQKLDIKQNQVVPLHLSKEPLVPGMQVFSFGYPMSHTGETALFINGYVSGFTERYADNRPSLAVLNMSLNLGNSGGPILHWIANQLKVVGVATQKHIKEILKFEESDKIEKIRKSMETNDISDISDENITHFSHLSPGDKLDIKPDPRQIPMNLLTLKVYDALETHSQFNLSNALPGENVIKFIEEAIEKCNREHKDELVEVVKRSADHSILPSGQHSASDCCIQ